MADFEMKLSLNVLNHLGINLYSNVPAILAEVVANAWDADAEKVTVTIAPDESSIVITDDGHGMTANDINAKFLTVGYQRREAGEGKTPKHGRDVMGRKGIGKLSLFSIADEIEVQSARNGERNGFTMKLSDIREKIAKGEGTYEPVALEQDKLAVTQGTTIVLRSIRKRLFSAEQALRKRIARRFSVIGAEHKFAVEVNGAPIGVEDRAYGHKLQYLWHYGPRGKALIASAKNLYSDYARTIADVDGWIGSVREAGALEEDGENLNRIVVMVRGKLAQEDILESFNEGGIYTKYLMGEIHADFLDVDEKEDIATSSRQAMIEDDPRYQKLKDAIQAELKHIKNQWTDLRNESGEAAALEIAPIRDWYRGLGADDRGRAKKLFGRINQLTIDDEQQRSTLLKHGVLAFESLRYRQNLDALENISLENLAAFAEIFGHHDDLEATLYHQIIAGRIRVVDALRQKVDDDVRERVIQEHLFDHLWLLDPAWERATETEFMEQRVETEFAAIEAGLTEEEKKGRLDLKYRKASGRHVIIELKRSGVRIDTDKLLPQVRKYQKALKKLLTQMGRQGEAIDIICVVGKALTDWTNDVERKTSEEQFKLLDARVVLYDELIDSAFLAYKEYLDKARDTGRVAALVAAIESSLAADEKESEAA